ncbi:hypothetical protein [Pseudomonas putida]|uniref:hypothetical protein n=1 Tax=Pseudomonas putida TaxID=303 RepID=UPI0012DA828A|nr:hypothetical protein [Pseudomonas putida]
MNRTRHGLEIWRQLSPAAPKAKPTPPSTTTDVSSKRSDIAPPKQPDPVPDHDLTERSQSNTPACESDIFFCNENVIFAFADKTTTLEYPDVCLLPPRRAPGAAAR